MGDTKAKIELEAGTSRLAAGLRSGMKLLEGFAEKVGLRLGGISDPSKRGGLSNILQYASGNVLGGFAMRGLDLVIDQGKKVIDFERELTRLGIDLNKQPEEMRGIGQAMRQISSETGIGADKVLAAGRAYADLAGAEAFTMDRMNLIARSAQASGSSVEDMAALMFTLTENMKVPDSQLEDTIGGLINQAKYGSIHFKELAHELVALGSVYSQFGVTGREGAIQIGAQMQLARHGFASASEAATGVLRIYRSLPQHASKFRKAHVEIFQDGSKTQLRPFEDIIHQIQKSKLALDREALIKSFGRTEGERFYQVLVALTGQYDQLKEAGRANGTVQRDLATYTESAAGRIDVAMERAKNSFAELLTPERTEQLVTSIEQIAAAIPAITSALGFVADKLADVIDMTRGIEDSRTGFRHYIPTKAEREAGEDPRQDERYAGTSLSGDWISKKHLAYEEAMDELVVEEGKTGPSLASIKHAVRLARQNVGTGGQAGYQAAGARYLRDRNISGPMRGRAEREIDKEEADAASARMASRDAQRDPYAERYDRALAQDRMAEKIGQAVKQGMMAAMKSEVFGGPFDRRR